MYTARATPPRRRLAAPSTHFACVFALFYFLRFIVPFPSLFVAFRRSSRAHTRSAADRDARDGAAPVKGFKRARAPARPHPRVVYTGSELFRDVSIALSHRRRRPTRRFDAKSAGRSVVDVLARHETSTAGGRKPCRKRVYGRIKQNPSSRVKTTGLRAQLWFSHADGRLRERSKIAWLRRNMYSTSGIIDCFRTTTTSGLLCVRYTTPAASQRIYHINNHAYTRQRKFGTRSNRVTKFPRPLDFK